MPFSLLCEIRGRKGDFFMADCPGCGKKIPVYQMSPYCKGCGVHLMFASFEGQFQKDRRIAEMSMAYFRYNMEKLRGSYVSNRALKFRIFAALAPVIALFIPLGSLAVNTPVYSSSVSFNVLGLVAGPFLTNGLFGSLDVFSAGPLFGPVAAELKTLILIYLAVTASAVIILLLELLSFIGNKKVSILTIIFSVFGIISSVLTKVLTTGLITAAAEAGSVVTASFGFMFILAALLFAVPLVASVFTLKYPPVYNFREGDELRVEYRRKYKKGEIELLNIPAPIYESEADKEEKRRLISEAYNMGDEKEEVTVSE